MLLEAHRWNLVSALDIKSMHCTGKKYIIQDNKKEHLYRRKLYRCLIHYALERPYYTMREWKNQQAFKIKPYKVFKQLV